MCQGRAVLATLRGLTGVNGLALGRNRCAGTKEIKTRELLLLAHSQFVREPFRQPLRRTAAPAPLAGADPLQNSNRLVEQCEFLPQFRNHEIDVH